MKLFSDSLPIAPWVLGDIFHHNTPIIRTMSGEETISSATTVLCNGCNLYKNESCIICIRSKEQKQLGAQYQCQESRCSWHLSQQGLPIASRLCTTEKKRYTTVSTMATIQRRPKSAQSVVCYKDVSCREDNNT